MVVVVVVFVVVAVGGKQVKEVFVVLKEKHECRAGTEIRQNGQ